MGHLGLWVWELGWEEGEGRSTHQGHIMPACNPFAQGHRALSFPDDKMGGPACLMERGSDRSQSAQAAYKNGSGQGTKLYRPSFVTHPRILPEHTSIHESHGLLMAVLAAGYGSRPICGCFPLAEA